MSIEALFVEAWRAGVTLAVRGNDLYVEGDSDPTPELIQKLRDHKAPLLHFLSHWISTPHGEAKLHPGYLPESFSDGRAGVVLREQPDRITWIRDLNTEG